jgi:hypothetical protein
LKHKRVLAPSGEPIISTTDLNVLAALILNKGQLVLEDRFMAMRMIFGGHIDPFDYHLAGLDKEFMDNFLTSSGFENLRKVGSPEKGKSTALQLVSAVGSR